MIELRRINAPKGRVSFFNLLNNSFFGRGYKRYLKPFPIARRFVLWIWTTILPIFLLIYAKYRFGSFPLKKLSEYASNRQVLFRCQPVQLRLPIVFPKSKKIILNSQTEFEFPEIYIATVYNAVVTGGSNFLSIDGNIVCHDLFRSSHDYASEELHSRFVVNSKESCVTYLSKNQVSTDVEAGVVFTDAVSGNYVHFLIEVLPRVFLFTNKCPNSNVTLMIDCGLHPNIMQALEMVLDKNMNLIGLEPDAQLLVKTLQVVSPCGYIPFQRRANTNHLTDHSDGIFSPIALGMMSDFIKGSVSKLVLASKFKKIFIKRNSEVRNITNAVDIENMLVVDGFVVIEPETLSFIEQVNIFSNAEVVVGATGAAFGNLIFCNTQTKIIILTSDYKNMIYGYWQNIANAVGNRVTYVIGESADVHSHLHSNFQVNILDIKDAIAS